MEFLKKLLPLLLAAVLTAGCTAAPAEPTLADPESATEKPTESATESTVPLSPESEGDRLQAYRNLFDAEEDLFYNLAAGIFYTRPADVNLTYFFHDGVGSDCTWEELTRAEQDLLTDCDLYPQDWIHIMPARTLEEKLQRYLGVGLDDVEIPEDWVYSADNDTYYSSNPNQSFVSNVSVFSYTDRDDGTVVLHLMRDLAYDRDFTWEASAYMTLRETAAGWQIVSNVPVSADPAREDAAAVSYYMALLDWYSDDLYTQALGTIFNTPEDVDLYYFFYNGVMEHAGWRDLGSAERDYLLANGFLEEMDIQIMPADRIEARLQKYFGLELEDVRIPHGWVYYAPTDCYYTNHNDAWLPYVTVTGVEEYPDGISRLYLTVDYVIDHTGEYVSDAETVLTLRKNADGSWHIVSHAFAQDVV